MKMLVTGGCGYAGSHFIFNALRKHKDISIINIDNCERSRMSAFNAAVRKIAPGRLLSVNADLTEDKVDFLYWATQCDAIVHFASINDDYTNGRIPDVERYKANGDISKDIKNYNINVLKRVIELAVNSNKRFHLPLPYKVIGREGGEWREQNLVGIYREMAKITFSSYEKDLYSTVSISPVCFGYGSKKWTFCNSVIKNIFVYRTSYLSRSNHRKTEWISADDNGEAILEIILKGKKGARYEIPSAARISEEDFIKMSVDIVNKSIFAKDHTIKFKKTVNKKLPDWRKMDQSEFRKISDWTPRDMEESLRELIEYYRYKITNRLVCSY